MKASILVVDDDPGLKATLAPAFKQADYSVRVAGDSRQALAALKESTPDLIVLDVRLPGMSGIELLGLLKKEPRTATIPVLMLTSRKAESEKVEGLHTGADDYVVKPFSIKELLARVEALLRRARHEGRMDRVIEAGGIRMDFDALEVLVNGRKVDLRRAEFNLLSRLMQYPGQVLTYQVLSESLSDGSKVMTSGTLQAHMKNLRQALGPAGDRIETLYGIGFKFNRD